MKKTDAVYVIDPVDLYIEVDAVTGEVTVRTEKHKEKEIQT